MVRMRIATFNVENFAHVGARFHGRPTSAPYDRASFDDKAGWIAGLIDEGRLDLIGFQEVFTRQALEETIARSKHLAGRATIIAPTLDIDPATGAPFNQRVDEQGRVSFDGPNVALVTQYEVLSSRSIPKFPSNVTIDIPIGLHDDEAEVVRLPIDAFERPVLEARVRLPGDVLATVYVAHLKSKRGKFLLSEAARRKDPVVEALASMRALIVRAAEAVALRSLLVAKLDDPVDGERGEPVVLLGDLNDDISAVTTEIIGGRRPPFYLASAAKQTLWDVAMTSVHDILAERSRADVAYTNIFDGKYSILDHIHVSQEFASGFPKRVGRVLDVRIFNDHLRDETLAMPSAPGQVVVDGDTLTLPSRRSDHGIPVAEIELGARPASTPA